MKKLLILGVLVPALAGASLGCKKKDDAGTASGTAPASAPAPASGSGTASAPAEPPAPPPSQTPGGAFAAVFDPVNSKLDHVSRARTACEQRAAWMDMIKAMDQSAAGVAALHEAIDEMGDPCDEGNIKAIEAKLDEAKQALDAVAK